MAEKTNPFREKMLGPKKRMDPEIKKMVDKHLQKWNHGKGKKAGDLEKAASTFADEMMAHVMKKNNIKVK